MQSNEGVEVDARFERESNSGLDNGRQHEGPCPSSVWKVHLGHTPRGQRCRELFSGVRWRLLWIAWLVGGIVVVVWVKGLSSQEGCSCLVVRNFGNEVSRERRLKLEV